MADFCLASVRCRVTLATGALTSAANLVPFAVDSSAAEPDLCLRLAPPDGPVAPAGSPDCVRPRGEALEFIRAGGRLRAENDFAACLVHAERLDADNFSGQPWLMLALWGYLAHRNGLLLHGACCDLDGRRILLLGPAQVGKSTLASLIVAAGGTCLTDEYPLMSACEGTLLAHASPWPGMSDPHAELSRPLHAIFFLRQLPCHELSPLSPSPAARRLIANNRFFTWSPRTLPVAFDLIGQLTAEVPIFEFGFAPEPSAVGSLREGL